MSEPAKRRATLKDVLPLVHDEQPVELVDGEIVRKALPTPEHGAAQAKLAAVLDPYHRKPGGPRGPGGWWLMTEVDVVYPRSGELYRHDAVGYRRDAHPERPKGFPVEARPDWACEILSGSTARTDTVKKQRTLHAHGVPYYWLLDPERKTLSVLGHRPDGYVVLLTAGPGETVHAEPFDGIPIELDELLGDV